MRLQGRFNGWQIVPGAVVEDIRKGGDHPAAEMVVARFASHPLAANANLDPMSLPAYDAVARHLMGSKEAGVESTRWHLAALGVELVGAGSGLR